jgi:hypothetical protein
MIYSNVFSKNFPGRTDEMRKPSLRVKKKSRHEIQPLNHPIAKLSSYCSSSTRYRTRSAVSPGFIECASLVSGIRDFFALWMYNIIIFSELNVNMFRT